MTFCLDSWAVVEWLEGREPAAQRVEDVLGSRPVMSWINVGEVAYITARRVGWDHANAVVGDLRRRLRLDAVTPARVMAAATVKASHTIAYADAFAVATALAHGATLLTGDPELLDGDPDWPVEDLRQ